jgi:hypothetical protein
MSVWYFECSTDDMDELMQDDDCITRRPRISNNGKLAILKYTKQVDGSIDHEAVLALCDVPAWQGEP